MFDFPPFPFVPLGGSPLRILIIFASALETSRDVLEIRRNLDRGLLLGVIWAGGLVAQNVAGITGIPGGSPPLPPFSEIVDPQLVDLPVSVTEAEPWILALECHAEVFFSVMAELCIIVKYLTAVMDVAPIRSEIPAKCVLDVFRDLSPELVLHKHAEYW